MHDSAGLDGPRWGRSSSARTPANGAFGPYMACLLKRGTEESNLEQGFWRPPCYRYTSPPKAQSIRFAGLLCMFGMWRRPSSCVSRVRPAAASRDQGYPRQRSGTTPRPQAVAPRPERTRCASRRRSSPVRAASLAASIRRSSMMTPRRPIIVPVAAAAAAGARGYKRWRHNDAVTRPRTDRGLRDTHNERSCMDCQPYTLAP